MVTRNQIEIAFGDDKKSYKTKNVDHAVLAISLLREKIPYESCKSIISASKHDILYLCDIEESMQHLSESDLQKLADCNVCVDRSLDSFYLFT